MTESGSARRGDQVARDSGCDDRTARLRAPFAGRRVAVIGLAREGVALTRYLTNRRAHVVVSDRAAASALGDALAAIRGRDVTLNLGGHDPDLLLSCDTIFVSAGVPRTLPVLVEAERRGMTLSSETELFFARCPVPIIGLTGSAGKTTTTTLVGEMIAASGQTVLVGGNIGRPLIEQVDEIAPDTRVVLELSSFQLQHLAQSPHVAAIVNVTPNHLDRHADLAEYAEAKRQIIAHQRPSDVAVLNADDPITAAFAERITARLLLFSLAPRTSGRDGVFYEQPKLVRYLGSSYDWLVDADDVRLPGRHNLANVAAAMAVCSALAVDPDAMRAVATTFSGVEHRLERVAEVGGVVYVNDSIATAPERLVAALHAIDAPVVLIAGGRDKHLPWAEAARLITARARAVVTTGEDAPLIETALRAVGEDGGRRPEVTRVETMRDAVVTAAHLAQPGDVVLLSPGCTSYDRYRNFEERGRDFKAAVAALAPAGQTA